MGTPGLLIVEEEDEVWDVLEVGVEVVLGFVGK